MRPAAPLSSYMAVSLSNVIATSCQYEALKYVTLPVQTLGKCAKMIPVMAWGSLISHKAYSVKDFCVAALVSAGCTGFLLSGKATSKGANQSSYLGFACMLVYLAFDGFTATFQVCSCEPPLTRACQSPHLPAPPLPFGTHSIPCSHFCSFASATTLELLQHVSVYLHNCCQRASAELLSAFVCTAAVV